MRLSVIRWYEHEHCHLLNMAKYKMAILNAPYYQLLRISIDFTIRELTTVNLGYKWIIHTKILIWRVISHKQNAAHLFLSEWVGTSFVPRQLSNWHTIHQLHKDCLIVGRNVIESSFIATMKTSNHILLAVCWIEIWIINSARKEQGKSNIDDYQKIWFNCSVQSCLIETGLKHIPYVNKSCVERHIRGGGGGGLTQFNIINT